MNTGNEFHGHHGPDHIAPMNLLIDRTSTEPITIYTGHAGCNVEIDGESGRVTGIHKDGKHVVGAFVHVPPMSSVHQAPGHMLYVALGKASDSAGDRHEVLSARLIDRDEFDRLNTLDQLRRDLGWMR